MMICEGKNVNSKALNKQEYQQPYIHWVIPKGDTSQEKPYTTYLQHSTYLQKKYYKEKQ